MVLIYKTVRELGLYSSTRGGLNVLLWTETGRFRITELYIDFFSQTMVNVLAMKRRKEWNNFCLTNLQRYTGRSTGRSRGRRREYSREVLLLFLLVRPPAFLPSILPSFLECRLEWRSLRARHLWLLAHSHHLRSNSTLLEMEKKDKGGGGRGGGLQLYYLHKITKSALAFHPSATKLHFVYDSVISV